LGKTTIFTAFVIVLGFSRAMYIEFVRHCTMDIFMDCHIHAFKYLRGTPSEILYDNMKNVVIGRQEGKVAFNHEFLHFSHHYNFQPLAVPPYSSWIKGKVERPMNFIRERFWRGYTFTNDEKANRIPWRAQLNCKPRVHGTHHQRIHDRWEDEISNKDNSAGGLRHVNQYFPQSLPNCQLSYNETVKVPHRMSAKRFC
jgi:transposase